MAFPSCVAIALSSKAIFSPFDLYCSSEYGCNIQTSLDKTALTRIKGYSLHDLLQSHLFLWTRHQVLFLFILHIHIIITFADFVVTHCLDVYIMLIQNCGPYIENALLVVTCTDRQTDGQQ